MIEKLKNKKVFIIILLLILFITTGYTSAYFTDTKTKSNHFNVGNNVCEIIEEFTKPQNYTANKTYSKKVRVKNVGTVPCYMRVFVEPSTTDVEITLNIDSSKWTKKDDYYYYNDIVNVNEETTNLLTSVTIGDTTSDKLKDFEVIVYSESVQADRYTSCYNAFNDMK